MKASCPGHRWRVLSAAALALCGCVPASNHREAIASPPAGVAGFEQSERGSADSRDETVLLDRMLAGKAAAGSCIEQIDHDLDEFLDCIRVRAQSARDDASRLGGLAWGWYTAWIHDAYAVAGARTATLTLMRALLPLQNRLGVTDAQLCRVIDAPCALVTEARRDTLARLSAPAP